MQPVLQQLGFRVHQHVAEQEELALVGPAALPRHLKTRSSAIADTDAKRSTSKQQRKKICRISDRVRLTNVGATFWQQQRSTFLEATSQRRYVTHRMTSRPL